MPNKTFGSLFSGGGGADIGAKMAGFEPVFAVEYDPDIAAVYRENIGDHVRVGDILDMNPSDFPEVALLHASPPCPNFSVAKVNGEETEQDRALAKKVSEFIKVLRPKWFTLENVRAYAKSKSFKIITDTLSEQGYIWDAPILNSANFGVPQTRHRLFLRASRVWLLRPLPEPVAWVGWYAAVEDLLPVLPESEFALWQITRLQNSDIGTVLMGGDTGVNGEMTTRTPEEPSRTVLSNEPALHNFKAFLMPNANTTSAVTRTGDEPAPTVGSVDRVGNVPRAFLLNGTSDMAVNAEDKPAQTVVSTVHEKAAPPKAFLMGDQERQVNTPEEPSATVRAYSGGGAAPRAFLVESRNTGQQRGDGLREETEPATTITTDSRPAHQPKAFVVQGSSASANGTLRPALPPCTTVKANDGAKQPMRAWLSQGRVVKMSARALARFQSFPDSYILPKRDKPRKFRKGSVEEKWAKNIQSTHLTAQHRAFMHEYLECDDALACRVIGNAVPPLLAKVVFESFLP